MAANRELEPDSWSHYLDSVSDDLRNQQISIEIIVAPRPPRVEATGLALQFLSYDRRGDVFEVAAARGGPGVPSILRRMVANPIRIEVDSSTSLAPTMISVDDGNGVRTVIRILRDGAFSG
jgi:hypothetical protein